MRVLTLIALLFVFTAGSFTDVAHATEPDHACAHHQLDHDDKSENETGHSELDQGQCDGCCCIHSHSMATPVTLTKTSPTTKQNNSIASLDDYYSAELAGLKRPPRL